MFEKEAAAIGLKVCVRCHSENEWLNGQCINCGCRDFRTREETLEAQRDGLIVGLLGLCCLGFSGMMGLATIYDYFFKNHVPAKPIHALLFLTGAFALGLILMLNAYNLLKYKKGHYFWHVIIGLSYAVEIIFLLLT